MKSLRTLFALLVLIPFLNTLSFSQNWTAQTSGTTEWLSSVYFTDASTAWADGADGTIIHTTDGGTTWTSQASGTTLWLSSVFFVDASTGWAVGLSGTIRHTTNGGATWTSQSSGTGEWLFSVYFTDANTGWISASGGALRHTTNGGATWTARTSGTANDLYSIYFADANNGWTVGYDGTILHTANGGITWTNQSSGTPYPLSSVFFTDVNNGWTVGSNGVILHTTNGGGQWTAQRSGTPFYLQSVFFTGPTTGWASGYFGALVHTTDGGTTWVTQSSGTEEWLNSLFFTDASTGWTVGSAGIILHTEGVTGLVPCDSLDLFQARCLPGGVVQTRVVLLNSTGFTGDEVVFEIDGTDYPAVIITNGVHSKAQVQTTPGTGNHTVALVNPSDCFQPIELACALGHPGAEEKWAYDDDPSSTEGNGRIGKEGGSEVVPLLENYPDPFNPSTTIRYSLGEETHVTLRVYNMLGQLMSTLVNENQKAGFHESIWNGSSDFGQKVASGMYIARLTAGKFSSTKRMLLLK